MTVLELIDELKRYDNDSEVLFALRKEKTRRDQVELVHCPAEKSVTLEFYGLHG